MAFLLTDSAVALPAETLPALKVTHFYGRPARGCVYAYWRAYLHRGDLCWCATVFDGAPRPTARTALAVSLEDDAGRYLLVTAGKDAGAQLRLMARCGGGPDKALAEPEAPAPRFFTGADEQGEYWAAEGRIPAAAFREAFGRAPAAGCVMPGNVFLYDTAEASFGAAFPCPGASWPCGAALGTFLAVPY